MNLWFDLKYAARLLLKSPLHSVLCVGVVALSVGLATFVYAVVYGAWLKPLDIPGSQRWYVVHAAANATADALLHALDPYTYQELLNSNRTVKHLGAVSIRPGVLSEGQASVSLRAYAISPSLLTATQVAPRLGRVFMDAETDPDSAPVAILSFETWANYFASDPAVVGKQARINGKSMQIIGVMPKVFSLGMLADLWLPLEKVNLTPASEATPVEAFIALEPAQTRAAVLQEMKTTVDLINRAYPERYNPGRHVTLAPAQRAYTDASSAFAAMLAVIAGAVGLLGSMNMGMMFFARLKERSRELALRNALGASRWGLLRQCLLESSVVVLLGLLAGVTLAAAAGAWAQNSFDVATEGERYVNAAEFVVRSRHVAVAVAAAIAIWLLSTLVPAWRIAQQDAAQVLAGSGKGTAGHGGAKTASFLVGLQVMISSMVLVACSNMVGQFYGTANKSTGFSAAQIITSRMPTKFGAAYAEGEKRLQYFDALAASVKTQLNGAEVGFATAMPANDSFAVPVAIESDNTAAKRDVPMLRLVGVSDNYFQLLGIRLRRGRLFDSTDGNSSSNGNSLNVAVLDENLVQRYWPNQDPLGKRIQLNPADKGPWLTVVGVVSHVGLDADPGSFKGKVYRPLRQSPPSEFVVIAKSPLGAAESRIALAAAAFAVDRDLPLNTVLPMEQWIEARSPKHTANIFIGVAVVTAFLVATGLFGLISRSVALRTQEVGVRRALGATQWQVIALFLRQGAVYLAVGIVFGGGAGIMATAAVGRISIYAAVLDHVVLVTSSVFLGLTAVILSASYVPTRRAVALEPGDALRYE